jgi:hypothetical protein
MAPVRRSTMRVPMIEIIRDPRHPDRFEKKSI